MCCGAAALFLSPHRVAADGVRVGIAKAEFVLPQRVPLAGYSRRTGDPSRGIHDPVGVRALVVEDADTTAALVSSDLLIVDERLFEAVRRRLLAEGIPERLVLLLAATHTHSGPGGYGKKFLEKISMGHFDPRVLDALVETISHAILRAYATRSPARMAHGTLMTQGLVVNRADPDGPVDAEVAVVAFYRPERETPEAVLVGFAAHPTTLGSWNAFLSADYPGVVARELERRFPASTCLFVAGAVGDQAPVKAGVGFERAEWIGQVIAREAEELLRALRPAEIQGVQALQERFFLPPARVRLNRRVGLPRWLSRQLVDDDATLSVVTVGETVFFGVPCDLAAALGQGLKASARARGLEPIVVGFASDYIGYCVSEAQYRTGTYEALMAFNGPATGPLLVERLTQMLSQVESGDS